MVMVDLDDASFFESDEQHDEEHEEEQAKATKRRNQQSKKQHKKANKTTKLRMIVDLDAEMDDASQLYELPQYLQQPLPSFANKSPKRRKETNRVHPHEPHVVRETNNPPRTKPPQFNGTKTTNLDNNMPSNNDKKEHHLVPKHHHKGHTGAFRLQLL